MGLTSIFSIELERGNGVFYAGEVVKGKVILDLKQDAKCRGLRIRLLGQSRIHWHTGSGDNRTDYDGRKVFQDHRITLFGNFFNSDVIDEGGSDPVFGEAMGEGTVYIPCEEETGPRELIVRVMDYDWGKRDDLLGECVLDAASLVASGAPKTFSLSRKGSMQSGKGGAAAQVTLSAQIMPLTSLIPTLPNGVRARYCLVLNAHSCANLRKADWVGRNDVYVQAYYPPQGSALSSKSALPAPETKTVIPAGRHEFSFVFPLRMDAPGSAEIGAGDYSYLRYLLDANIDLANWKDPRSRRAITVIPSRPMPTPALLVPATSHPPEEDAFNCTCCCCRCCKSGTVGVSLSTGRQSYAIGERIDVTHSRVVNNTNRVMGAQLVLQQYIVLRQTGRIHNSCTHGSNRTVAVLASMEIYPGQDSTDFCTSQVMRMPPTPPSFFGSRGRAWGNEPLTWTYALELRVSPTESTFASTVLAAVPILVPAAPAYASQMQQEAVLAAAPDDVTMATPWMVEAKAMAMAAPSDIGPLLSGTEDAGAATLVVTGYPVEVATPHERKYFEGPSDQLHFQPFELQWPEALDEPLLGKLGFQASDNAVGVAGGGDTGGTFEDLESTLKTSSDRRTAVGEWVKASPVAASRVSPSQVAAVLRGTLLSLEQGSVARELGAGLGSRLTCSHVVAAVEACPFAKTDVAMAMAPYVSDKQNRSAFLDLLFSFDRDRVEGAMDLGNTH